MSNEGRAIERRIILSYVPLAARDGVGALLALDDRLGAIVAAVRDPLIGQMRLTWWHGALLALDTTPAPAEPVLQALANEVVNKGISGQSMAQLVDGWEALLAIESDPAQALAGHAEDRGAALFVIAATVIGGSDDRLADAGEGWALADAYARTGRGAEEARARLDALTAARWPPALRALSAMALSARLDLAGASRPGTVARAVRLLRHRLTGR